MLLEDAEMDEDVALDLVADHEAEAAGRVEPFHRPGDRDQALLRAGVAAHSSARASSPGSPAGGSASFSRRVVILRSVRILFRQEDYHGFCALVNCFSVFLWDFGIDELSRRGIEDAPDDVEAMAGAQHRRGRLPPGIAIRGAGGERTESPLLGETHRCRHRLVPASARAPTPNPFPRCRRREAPGPPAFRHSRACPAKRRARPRRRGRRHSRAP
jgi:hypothetical protein